MIRLEDVYLSLGGRQVLEGISFEIGKAERAVILGPSGAGRSSILRVILGLWKPDRGGVQLDGEDIHALEEKELIEHRKRLAMVFQGGALFDTLTVGENVGYRLFEEGRLPVAQIEAIVRRVLAAMGLEDAIDLFPGQLSGGMRKRVAIARAIAVEPACILFDEPTAGLDPLASSRVNELIVECQRHGKATLVVTHDLVCAYRVGERFMFIDDGKILFDGDRRGFESCPNPQLCEFLNPGGGQAGASGGAR
ncbi:ABC transporter ATP-binding protein [Desulfuromonas versatilis]|uniref:ABC transporter ATP-binding protein n=1 Tax=Desulfuromonas versatilis TaxID=2802975 RepID=A0ABN6DZX7_9BACT|nr:ATP-binding cassette domain-containing protein [Desulfuromonas versatilis]BCR05605.1 ABC transporter ATP-binding protein [Desulfuromonas versatilis]